MQNRHYIILLN